MEFLCFDGAPLSAKNGLYGGMAGAKEGIRYHDENWMLKFPENVKGMQRVDISYSTAPLSEYLGSHVYEILGYDVHDTLLGERAGKVVVACKDFTDENHSLLEFRTIKNAYNQTLEDALDQSLHSTGSEHLVDLENLLIHLKYNPVISQIPEIEEHFWEQAIIDIFINNNDRNNGNWGILRDMRGVEPDMIAPVFDNGGSFQNKLSEDKIKSILDDRELAIKNASNTQTVYGIDGHALSSKKFLTLTASQEGLRKAIIKVVPLIASKMSEIEAMFQDIPEYCQLSNGTKEHLCSKERKELFLLQLHARHRDLLLPAYEHSININMAQNRNMFTRHASQTKTAKSLDETIKQAEEEVKTDKQRSHEIECHNINHDDHDNR